MLHGGQGDPLSPASGPEASGPGLLLHGPVSQGDDNLVDIGNDPGI